MHTCKKSTRTKLRQSHFECCCHCCLLLRIDFLSEISYLYGSKIEQCKCHFKMAISTTTSDNQIDTNTSTPKCICDTKQKMSLDTHKTPWHAHFAQHRTGSHVLNKITASLIIISCRNIEQQASDITSCCTEKCKIEFKFYSDPALGAVARTNIQLQIARSSMPLVRDKTIWFASTGKSEKRNINN